MGFTITLCSDCTKDVCLALSDHFEQFSGQGPLDVVYQDVSYHYMLDGTEIAEQITDIVLFVNGRKIAIRQQQLINENGIIRFALSPKNREAELPFFLFYGVVDIAVCVQYEHAVERYLFSPHLAVAVKKNYSYDIEAIKEMLCDIYKKDHALLHRRKVQNGVNSSYTYRRTTEDKFFRETTLLTEILTSLKHLFPYFMRNPYTVAIPEWSIDSFEKLHMVQSENLNYIVTHPEQLHIAQSSSGILVHNQRMIPDKTLVGTSRFSCDTKENRAIISFIYTLMLSLEERKVELFDAIRSVACVQLKDSVLESYIISASVIQEYTRMTITEQLTKIENLLSQFTMIFHQYTKALPCSYSVLRRIPMPTHCFLEIYHYRQIYELMNCWFAIEDYTIPANTQILQFTSADTIYEYFCLLNLYDIIVRNGFIEYEEQRTNFQYSCVDSWYVPCQNDNTFYFAKGSCNLTLYYQPLIYSEDCATRNGITLFRVDGKRVGTNYSEQYYSPDFVIKKQTTESITYCILDAKWRAQEVLLSPERSGGLRELSYKYQYSILDENGLNNSLFFWLLQGKDDGKPTYYHHSGGISKKQSSHFGYSTGIVRLSPRFGNQELYDILSCFLRAD